MMNSNYSPEVGDEIGINALLQMFSDATNRSFNFWRAWTTQEHGWKYEDEVTGWNVFNISSDGKLTEPWFYGVTKVNPNATVVYPNIFVAYFDTLLFIQQEWPNILTASTDADAALVLNGSGKMGVWATTPNYGTDILSIMDMYDKQTAPPITVHLCPLTHSPILANLSPPYLKVAINVPNPAAFTSGLLPLVLVDLEEAN